MPTVPSHCRTLNASPEAVEEAARVLRAGGLVVFPTDTVYGLGADPANPEAVERVYQVKGRESGKPLQLLLAEVSQLCMVATEVSDLAWEAARRFMPGGITLVLKKAPGVPLSVVAGGATVGVRVPQHDLCRALIRAFGGPVAATSANRSGGPSPATAAEAAAQVGDDVDLVLDGGPCPVGRDSTVLDLSGPGPRVLREGAVGLTELCRALGITLETGY
ncbi:MAG: threonylcarbamoyl-AMP synthase [Chloroflexi bacterium]|nr:threonylcarbamoyl-AMP synthase [Chloroflexota bacterium]